MQKSSEKIKIWHVITGLGTGGAETMLAKLLSRMDPVLFDITVFSMMPINYEEPVPQKLKKAGIPFYSLNMKKSPSSFLSVFNFMLKTAKQKPDILQAWMYHADFLTSFFKLVPPFPKVIWNIRNESYKTPDGYLVHPLLGASLPWLSYIFPDAVIHVSHSALKTHTEKFNYNPKSNLVISNGFETDKFKSFTEDKKKEIKQSLGIPENHKVILFPARFVPIQKDLFTFFAAAEKLLNQRTDVTFLLCGRGMFPSNKELQSMIPPGFAAHFKLLGIRHDMPNIYNAADFTTLISLSEGFPNVLGESMSCETPCVSTPAGDSELIVGDTGIMVPFKNPRKTLEAWMKMLNMPEEEKKLLGEKARKRVLDNYSLDVIVKRYESLYFKVMNN